MENEEMPSWASEPCMMGIDEAGRGPVLGSMVYGCAYCPISYKDQLAQRDYADSKTLTEEKREALFAQVLEDSFVGHAIDSLSAQFISGEMLRSEKVSLNVLANDSTFRLIDTVLARGVRLQEIYVDTVGDAAKWQARLSDRYPGITFVVCPKADALYPIVSAASIMAKVTRDRELRAFQCSEGVSVSSAFGTGYPADPDTKAWLEQHVDPVFGFPTLVRFSWQTCTRLLSEKGAAVKWECDDEAGALPGQTCLHFGGKGVPQKCSTGAGRHSFFRARKLQRI